MRALSLSMGKRKERREGARVRWVWNATAEVVAFLEACPQLRVLAPWLTAAEPP